MSLDLYLSARYPAMKSGYNVSAVAHCVPKQWRQITKYCDMISELNIFLHYKLQ